MTIAIDFGVFSKVDFSAQKEDTRAILLKTALVRVSCIQIIQVRDQTTAKVFGKVDTFWTYQYPLGVCATLLETLTLPASPCHMPPFRRRQGAIPARNFGGTTTTPLFVTTITRPPRSDELAATSPTPGNVADVSFLNSGEPPPQAPATSVSNPS